MIVSKNQRIYSDEENGSNGLEDVIPLPQPVSKMDTWSMDRYYLTCQTYRRLRISLMADARIACDSNSESARRSH